MDVGNHLEIVQIANMNISRKAQINLSDLICHQSHGRSGHDLKIVQMTHT